MRCQSQADPTDAPATGRRDALVDRLRSLFSDLSGMDAASIDTGAAFLELGLDSLVLTQAALLLQKTFDVKISFRELLEELSTIDALAAHLDGVLPAEAAPVPARHTGSDRDARPARRRRTARPKPRPAERSRS